MKEMGATFSCNFCDGGGNIENLNFQNCCDCFAPSKRRDSVADGRGIVYATSQGPDQFVLLNTPFIEVKEWMDFGDLQLSSVILFCRDGTTKKIRIISHHEPEEASHRMSATMSNISDGSFVEDIFPPHLKAPLTRFMLDTLDGCYYQLCGLFSQTAKIIRCYPLTDSEGFVVAGVMIVGPFNLNYDAGALEAYASRRSPSPERENEPTPESPRALPSTVHLGRMMKKNSTL